ncbi:hypothetical protein SERLA73DRAFT_94359 [Serpula lacrymans var. lacrymans S7.3]|uniref:Amidohydrolase-related domain-containing protein n=2 Tax=Serpula lacrymans var. lacrymans TaxID=341189 RepID=F8Q6M6_SERL3|nr:uncharacterized protein SERLADRAFT_357566 [Serpula lacrymans var. lacrymans S7.9]EGN96264.1 hypothetical protein SERLA73DRAFT_94359 [Serpula lacrymans var. lacrymans S7.3]EGO21803.1 hypothetical protein SERLADRAFT_357566 [Serpula lacrymans var. lacrymans S7.9]
MLFVYVSISLIFTARSLLRKRFATQPSFGIATQSEDPSSEFRDDVFPFRQPAPWDISTDFPYPRLLEYDVTEGTWLRLDVHPVTGDIVFDMAGDLYCLPAESYKSGGVTTANPILVGVPYDSDPHFSPQGDKLVFRSDAELGFENIWVMQWSGCEEMNVRSGSSDVELREALKVKEHEDNLLAKGVSETGHRKRRRLVREGRLGATRVTNETYHWVSDARFHPSGSKVVATKWYYTSRSLGSGEGWEYDISECAEVGVGAGRRVVSRSLPTGWGATNYGDQQIGPEQFVWAGEDKLIFSKNIRDTQGTFAYSKDVHKGIYAIFSKNLTSGKTETIVDAYPGGASRPELSRDGRTLAFVRRVRDKEALVLKDLQSGTVHNIWYGLTYDLSTISAPMGTYPSFAFSPNDDAVIIWAAGQIYSVPLSLNLYGEKIAGGTPSPIRFVAHIEKRLAETRQAETDIVGLETQDLQRVHAFKELRVDYKGKRAIFQAAGITYIQEVGHDTSIAEKIPVLKPEQPYYSPAFVSGFDNIILHARWSDADFTTLEIANLSSQTAHEVTGLPLGRYYSPVLCECIGTGRMIAFVKTGGDLLTGDIVATAGEGLYIGHITLPSYPDDKVIVSDLKFVSSEVDTEDVIKLQFLDSNKKLLVQQSDRAFIININAGADTFGNYLHETLASGKETDEIIVSTRSKGDKTAVSGVAFVNLFHVYYVPGTVSPEEPVWSKPGNATAHLARLSLDGGHDVTISRDGKVVFWLLGPYLHYLELSKLSQCSSDINKDPSNFGISCIKGILNYQEIFVHHSSDIARLKQEALDLDPANLNADLLVIKNATILTMDKAFSENVLHGGVLTVRGGVIESVNLQHEAVIPNGATVVDAEGGFVIPGFIDAHAHWDGFETLYPAASWELETFLAYGVTTLHNPSSHNVLGYIERSRLESGQMVGPRIFHTGRIIYGASSLAYHQDIADSDEARTALLRIKVEGGPASFSYKNYNLPSRASRQRLLLEARNFSMLCVPEGGMNYDWDLTYIIDGMTTVEHNLPVAKLYDDILTLYARSGTGATPTHIVNYGGVHGEQVVWATQNVPNDPKLRRFTRHDVLEGLSESTARPHNSLAFYNTSESIANLVDRGLLAHIGAHGEPPLGLNYHEEMFFATVGGLSNYEVIRAATSSAAITFGLYDSLGSLTPGKLADILIYPSGIDLLHDDIRTSREIRYVVRGGRIWDAETMVEVWPVKGRKQVIPPINAD